MSRLAAVGELSERRVCHDHGVSGLWVSALEFRSLAMSRVVQKSETFRGSVYGAAVALVAWLLVRLTNHAFDGRVVWVRLLSFLKGRLGQSLKKFASGTPPSAIPSATAG